MFVHKTFVVFVALLLALMAKAEHKKDDSTKILASIERDLNIGQIAGDIASTLKCLLGRYNKDIDEKMHNVWHGSLELAQQQTILHLTADQYMDLVHYSAFDVLKKLQSIHEDCARIPYPCKSDADISVEIPENLYNLRDSIENLSVLMLCLLSNDKNVDELHNIFAKGFKRYHGSCESLETSLEITEAETAYVVTDLKKIDKLCQVMSVEEPCFHVPENEVKRSAVMCNV